MLKSQPLRVSSTPSIALSANRVMRNTYALLALTLLFSAITAGLSIFVQAGPVIHLVCVLLAFALMWLVLPRTAESAAGIGVVFAITGLLGFGLGPVLSYYLSLPNGSQVVGTALGGTGLIFLALSGYALLTRRDFSFMGGFLMIGLVVVLVGAIANIFLAIPTLSLIVSAAIILIMSGFILFDTSRIVNGGETNYVLATISIYLSIYNIFLSLLHILGIGGDE